MKVSKPTKKPPVTALGKVKIDDSIGNPRSYLKNIGDNVAAGYTKVEGDLDPRDNERNVDRMKCYNSEEKSGA